MASGGRGGRGGISLGGGAGGGAWLPCTCAMHHPLVPSLSMPPPHTLQYDVVVTAGANQAFVNATLTLCDETDQVRSSGLSTTLCDETDQVLTSGLSITPCDETDQVRTSGPTVVGIL